MRTKHVKAIVVPLLVIITIYFTVITDNYIYSQEAKIRIVKEHAVLRLKPSNVSKIIKKLPLGSEYDVDEKLETWIKIKLPPDKDGIVVTGYVRRSFVEFEIKPEAQKEMQQKVDRTEDKVEVSTKDAYGEDYYDWKKELSSAKSRRSTGLILTVSGSLVFATCMILTFVHQRTEYGFLYYEEKARDSYLVGDALGLVTLIGGLAIYLPARRAVKRLEGEARMRGYLKAGLISKYKALGVQIGVLF